MENPEFKDSTIVLPSVNNRVVSSKEFITKSLNEWKGKLIDRTAAYHEALIRRNLYPTAVIQTQSMGTLSISAVVSSRIDGIREARAFVKVYEDMLKNVSTAGYLEDMWSDEKVIDVKVINKDDLEDSSGK